VRRLGTFWTNVWALAYREALVLRHDTAFITTVVAQPIMMVVLFGWVLSNEPVDVPWAVLDRSGTAVSRRLVDDVVATGYFLPPARVTSYAAGRALLVRQDALALLVVPEDYRRDVERGRVRVQLLLDGSDPLTSARVGGYVVRVAARVGAGRAGPVGIRQRFFFNPTLDDHAFFLTVLAGTLLTNFCLSATALSLVGEREEGTYEQVLSLPTSWIEIVLGKMVPYLVVAHVLASMGVLAAGLIFGIWPLGSWLALAAVTLPFVLASLAIGVFISAIARTSAQAVFVAVFFIMPSFVLSGVMLPYQLMPEGVREVGGLVPLRWYQIALRRIISRGGGLGDVLGPLLALLVLFGVLLAAIRWRMRPRLG